MRSRKPRACPKGTTGHEVPVSSTHGSNYALFLENQPVVPKPASPGTYVTFIIIPEHYEIQSDIL